MRSPSKILLLVIGAAALYGFHHYRQVTFRKAALEHVTYYRFQSSYVVKATGEQIDFDYVAACAVIETTYKDGDRSMDTLGVNPQTFIKATKDGYAIQVWKPSACDGEV